MAQTLFEQFLAKAAEKNILVSFIPHGGKDDCALDYIKRIIFLGASLPLDVCAVVGFHELGHLHTMSVTAFTQHLRYMSTPSREGEYFRYAYELAAWAWAEQQIPLGYEAIVAEAKEHGLRSYMDSVTSA